MDELWGDRSGVLHMARNQHWSFGDFNIYLPVNMMSYKYVLRISRACASTAHAYLQLVYVCR